MENKMPVFVRIDEYKDVLEVLRLLEKKVQQAREIIVNINELKNQEDAELAMWQSGLSEVEKRIGAVGSTLLEPSM